MISKFPEEDRKLIAEFLEKVKSWAPPHTHGGNTLRIPSAWRFRPRSDIDMLMIFDEPNPGRHLTEITKLITRSNRTAR